MLAVYVKNDGKLTTRPVVGIWSRVDEDVEDADIGGPSVEHVALVLNHRGAMIEALYWHDDGHFVGLVLESQGAETLREAADEASAYWRAFDARMALIEQRNQHSKTCLHGCSCDPEPAHEAGHLARRDWIAEHRAA
jgi:hypothetical protein